MRRRITILMATLAVAVFGWFSLKRLEIKLLPEISYPTITVRTEIPGAPPEEVENLVSRPIEEVLGVINDLQTVTSVSMAGLSDVVLELNWDSDVDQLILDIREKLNDLTLPEEAEKPRILRYNPETEPIMKIALSGDDLVLLHRLAEREIKPRLEAVEGVASAQILGGDKEEIRIELDLREMASYQISFDRVSSRLREENINLPGGILEDADTNYLVRIMNEFRDISEIGDIVVGVSGTAVIRLRDIAAIVRIPVEKKSITHLAGRESVEIDIYKEGDANIIEVADRVTGEIGARSRSILSRGKSLMDLLPEKVELKIISNQSVFIRAAIDEVKQTAVLGSLLAVVILFLFLRSLPHTLTVALAIPISIIATFTLMFFKNISLNLMSLGGIALGVGMLVDNAIVVLENIFRRRESGESAPAAAHQGGEDVATAVTASTLTTIAVFFPIVFVSGIAGQIFQDLAWTVAFSLLASLIVALSLIPMITSIEIGRISARISPIWFTGKIRKTLNRYQPPGQGAVSFWKVPAAFLRCTRQDAVRWFGTIWKTTWRYPAIRGRTLRWFGLALLTLLKLIVFPVNILLQITGFLLLHILYFILLPILASFRTLWKFIKLLLDPVLNLFDILLRRSRTLYIELLQTSFRHSRAILLVCLAVLAGTIVLVFPRLGMNLIPSFAQGEFYIDIKMPVGTPLEKTEAIVYRVEEYLTGMPQVDLVSAVIGSSSGELLTVGTERENLATIQVVLKPEYASSRQEYRLTENLRGKLQTIPGIEKSKFRRPSLFSLKTPLEIEVRGYNLDMLFQNANRIVEDLNRHSEFADVFSTLEPGYPEVQIVFDRLKLARLGLSPAMIAGFLHNTVEGEIPTDFGEYGNEIDVRVRAKRERSLSLNALKQMVINPGAGSQVQLSSVADIREIVGPSEIRRVDQHRVALVRADVRLLDLKSALKKVESVLNSIPPGTGVTYAVVGQSSEMDTSVRSLRFALLLAIFLVYLVMASQFESLIHPLIIILSIPMAVIGVLIGLWILNIPLSVVVFMGMIVLAGIAVNNAIVLIDTVNQMRRGGQSVREALLNAGSVRFRPILMTAMTTILGLLPMALQTGPGSEIRTPLAATVILGLIASTFLTLIIIPIVYRLVSRETR